MMADMCNFLNLLPRLKPFPNREHRELQWAFSVKYLCSGIAALFSTF